MAFPHLSLCIGLSGLLKQAPTNNPLHSELRSALAHNICIKISDDLVQNELLSPLPRTRSTSRNTDISPNHPSVVGIKTEGPYSHFWIDDTTGVFHLTLKRNTIAGLPTHPLFVYKSQRCLTSHPLDKYDVSGNSHSQFKQTRLLLTLPTTL